jgi:hypothetical protein
LVSTETIGLISGDGIAGTGDQKDRHMAEVDRGSAVEPTAELAAAETASTEVGSASPPTISTAGGVVIEKASPSFVTGQGERHIWLAFCSQSN